MRTPTEIFEEVLDVWDDDAKAFWSESPFPGPHLDEHRAKVAAYREEFRQSLEAEAQFALGAARLAVRGIAPDPYPSEYPPADPVHLSDASPESTASAEEAFGGPSKEEIWNTIDRCSRKTYDFWQEMKDHESVADRAERTAERYTKDDGSAK